MQLKINEIYKNKEITKLVTIINVYGPTSQRAEKDPDELDSFYTKLDETINSVGRSSILILAGYFNAKVGHKQQIDHTCIGNYSKGKRNHNGEKNSARREDFSFQTVHLTTHLDMQQLGQDI